MATGMIKRGSGSAYTRLIRRWRMLQIRGRIKGARAISRLHLGGGK